jgi:DNA-binding NarL/FixJ family response regulator
MFRKLIARYLLKRRGVVVVGEAVSGDEALNRVEELKPDIMILDVNMPDQSCATVWAAIREHLPTTRIYLCSAHSDRIPPEIASSVEADGVLRKSSLGSDLMKMVQTELRKKLYRHGLFLPAGSNGQGGKCL